MTSLKEKALDLLAINFVPESNRAYLAKARTEIATMMLNLSQIKSTIEDNGNFKYSEISQEADPIGKRKEWRLSQDTKAEGNEDSRYSYVYFEKDEGGVGVIRTTHYHSDSPDCVDILTIHPANPLAYDSLDKLRVYPPHSELDRITIDTWDLNKKGKLVKSEFPDYRSVSAKSLFNKEVMRPREIIGGFLERLK